MGKDERERRSFVENNKVKEIKRKEKDGQRERERGREAVLRETHFTFLSI